MASYKYRLPVEQWRQVLMNNSPGDLCNVVLVSRHMYSVASLPELWAGMKVNMMKVKENGLKELYNIKRFKKVKQIKLDYIDYFESEELERLLQEIPGSPLESANMLGQRLSRAPAELLANAVSHLNIVNLHGTNLTNDQCVSLLKASLSSTTLSNVNLNYINLSKVPSDLLANSISRLQEVSLRTTRITKDQRVALLKASLTSTTLRNVNLEYVDLCKVPSDLLANAISRLQDVNLYLTRLTTDQCVALFKASLTSTTLRNVNLDYVYLSKVPSDLLANAISRLQDVYLCHTGLTTDQCVALLKASLSATALKNVNLDDINLSEVPSELLANSISRLQRVNLRATRLTTDQCLALLKANLSSTTLTYVNLNSVDLSKVLAELLANSISRLHEVNLRLTGLTTEQCVVLLKASLYSATLRKVDLEKVALTKVPSELLANSISRLQDVRLNGTFLTSDQCVALLKASHSSSTLHRIDLDCNSITKKIPSDKQYLLTTLQAHVNKNKICS